MRNEVEQGAHAVEVRKVPLGLIKTHPGLQPRDASLLYLRDGARQETQSEQHIQNMAVLLKSDASQELTPVSLAEVEGTLYVVDGHHRLKAYGRAKRREIPARVRSMTIEKASHESKLANIQGAQMEMHAMQRRNALWHHLAYITQGGTLELPGETSQKKLAGRFGVSRETIQRMLRRLPEVNPEKFPQEHRDAITGWPHWRYMAHSVRNDLYMELPVDVRVAWKAGRYRKKLTKLWDQFGPEVIELAHIQMRAEAGEAAQERRAEQLEAAYWGTREDPEVEF